MFHIKRVVDLSQSMYHEMPGWPTHSNFTLEMSRYIARDGYSLHSVRMTTHHGTHIDVPRHIIEDGKTTDQYPIDAYMGEGVVLDLSSKNAREEITVDDLTHFDSDIKEGDVVLLHTGWDKKRGYNADYLYGWPYLGESGAKLLVSKRLKAVGTEGLSIAPSSDHAATQDAVTQLNPAISHKILLENDIIIVEEMANLSALLDGNESARAYIVFAPLPIQGVDGCPTRAFALVN